MDALRRVGHVAITSPFARSTTSINRESGTLTKAGSSSIWKPSGCPLSEIDENPVASTVDTDVIGIVTQIDAPERCEIIGSQYPHGAITRARDI